MYKMPAKCTVKKVALYILHVDVHAQVIHLLLAMLGTHSIIQHLVGLHIMKPGDMVLN